MELAGLEPATSWVDPGARAALSRVESGHFAGYSWPLDRWATGCGCLRIAGDSPWIQALLASSAFIRTRRWRGAPAIRSNKEVQPSPCAVVLLDSVSVVRLLAPSSVGDRGVGLDRCRLARL